jgi:8-oxo-dGTP pyrophosphatase MutT (NUDIX family)
MTLKRRAGMIPYFVRPDGTVEFLLMVPVNPKLSNKPQIAKGWMDDGEDAYETARREAKEELGLKKKNMKRVPLHLGQWDNTEIFMVEIRGKENFKPVDKDEVKKTIWLTVEEFRKAGRRSNRPVIELANIIVKHITHLESK